MAELPAPLVVDRVLGARYRLMRPIARGGMAEVWEAFDETLDRAVAVKVLHRHLAGDRGFRERFRREAVAAARLAHPNVVATYDAATAGDEAFIVMELVRGRSLRQALLREGPMAPDQAVSIALQVAAALGHAHAHGVIHRDVKPSNILLAEEADGWVRAKVADFGIAKAVASSGDLTETGNLMGTVKYLSPEQVEGAEPDARSDIYALGVTLYESVCGQPPFLGDTDLATALARVRSDPVPPRRLQAGIPRPLEATILHAMARDPAERPQTTAELQAELAAIDLRPDDATALLSFDPTPPDGVDLTAVTPRPVPAPPPPPAGARRGRSRRPLAMLSVAALVIAVVVASVLAGRSLRAGTGEGSGRRATTTTALAADVSEVTAFDPEGGGHEHDEQARLAIDGDPATAWESEDYRGPRFGNLKDGVGLVMHLSGPSRVHRLQVTSPTQGWSAQVYVAAAAGESVAEWGQPVATQTSIDGDATFELGGASGAAVLLWITDQGTGSTISISELGLS